MNILDKEFEDIARLMQDTAVGPLLAASKVMSIAKEWEEKWQSQANGATSDHYVKDRTGRKLFWWERRATARQVLGRTSALHHEVACSIMRKTFDPHQREALVELFQELHRKNLHIPVEPSKAGKIINTFLGTRRKRTCKTCVVLIAKHDEECRAMNNAHNSAMIQSHYRDASNTAEIERLKVIIANFSRVSPVEEVKAGD